MKKIILIILAIVFLQACGDATLTPDNNTSEFMPLKAGNYWITISKNYDLDRIDTMRLECLSDTTYLDKKWWFLKYAQQKDTSWNNKNIYSKDIYLMKTDNNGISMLGDDNRDKEFIMFKYPVKTGDQYLSFKDSVVVLNTDTTMILFSKVYKNVIIYKASEPLINGDYNYFYKRYVCPGIGLIKLEQYLVGTQSFPQRLIAAEELFEYKIY
jgi:hypothetical protein